MKLVLTYLFVLIQFVAFTQTDRDFVRSGNKNYSKDSLNLAIEDYEAALKINPQFEEAKFNLGDAYYKQEKFADAASTFNELAQSTPRKELKSNAFFNEGNALMQMQKFENAMTSYKKAMYANPQNADARYNYEYARKMRIEQQEQEKKDDQDKKDDQNKEDQKDQDKKDQDKDGDKDKDEQDKNKDDKKDGDQDKDKQDKGDQNKDEDQKKPQQPQDQPGQMSQADAERLLKAMAEDEKKTREKVALQKAKSKSKKKSEKDW